QALSNLGRGRGLTGTLETNHHDDDRRRRIEVDRLALRAKHFYQFVMDDLDDHLAGLDRLQDGCAYGLFPHTIGKGANNVEGYVCLDQSPAHFTQCCRNIGFRQGASPGQAVQDGAKAFLQVLKHLRSFVSCGGKPNTRGNAFAPGIKPAKLKSTRGRNALPGVDLRDRVPVGCSESKLVAKVAPLNRKRAEESSLRPRSIENTLQAFSSGL